MSNAEEQFLIDQLARLQQQYHEAAEPYIRRLMAIRCMQAPEPILVDAALFHTSFLAALEQEQQK